MASEQQPDLQMDANDLWQEEVFTDRRVGSIQRLTPVTREGKPDESRSVRYVGQTQLMTPAGALPLSFELEADSLGKAVQQFGSAAQQAAQETMEKLKEMSRERASSIVTPDSDPNSFGGGGGGLGGGGGILGL